MTSTGVAETSQAAARDSTHVELVLAQIDSLPTLPVVAAKLLALTLNDRSGVREVIELIESDPSLSARLLAMVRRADVGSEITTVDRAAVLLGMDAIRNLVLSIQIFETFRPRSESGASRFDRAGFWMHSLATGCACRSLAARASRAGAGPLGQVRPEEAFLCGLLHDLGKVALDACFPKSYDRVITRVEDLHADVAKIEREVFGLDHVLAGKRLAARWKLPEMIVESIWLGHHTPASTPTRIAHAGQVQLVQIADRLVREMRIGYSGNHTHDVRARTVAEDAGLPATLVEEVKATLPDDIEARAALVGVDDLTSKKVYQEALGQANAELARINATLQEKNRHLAYRALGFEALCALNGGLSEEATLDDICRAAADAISGLVPRGAVGVFGRSPSRSVLTLAGRPRNQEGVGVTVNRIPVASAGDLTGFSRWGSGWVGSETLPGPLRDELSAVMGAVPTCCRLIRHQDRFFGGLVLADEAPAGGDEAFEALAEGIGVWFGGAESRTISLRLNEELAEMNRDLVASQAEVGRMRSLAMVGDMAAGAAHELNNPLTVIAGRAELLLQDADHPGVAEPARLISEHAHRASAIVNALMEFAKPALPKPTVWSLGDLLGDVRQAWLEKSGLSEEQFELGLSDDLPKVRADATQTRKLFDEVIDNAIEAMADASNRRLVVNCRANLTDEKVVISVQDNGRGMTTEVLEQAMTPFFSHRSAGRGRGLGLSRAARHAEINGGRVRLSSQPGQGTVVFVELPTA